MNTPTLNAAHEVQCMAHAAHSEVIYYAVRNNPAAYERWTWAQIASAELYRAARRLMGIEE